MARNIKVIPSTVPLHAVGPGSHGRKAAGSLPTPAFLRTGTSSSPATRRRSTTTPITSRAALTGSSFPYIQTKERPAVIPASARASRTWWTMPLTGK